MVAVKRSVVARSGGGNKWAEQRIFKAVKILYDTIMMDA